MGVDFRVVLYARAAGPGRMAAGRALARVEALNQILSDYVADSEVRRLVRDRERHKVSTELWRVLSYGQSVARESQGAFDVTVGPYVLAARQYRFFGKLPPPDKLARMKASTIFSRLANLRRWGSEEVSFISVRSLLAMASMSRVASISRTTSPPIPISKLP